MESRATEISNNAILLLLMIYYYIIFLSQTTIELLPADLYVELKYANKLSSLLNAVHFIYILFSYLLMLS